MVLETFLAQIMVALVEGRSDPIVLPPRQECHRLPMTVRHLRLQDLAEAVPNVRAMLVLAYVSSIKNQALGRNTGLVLSSTNYDAA